MRNIFSLLINTDQKSSHFVHSCKMIFNVRKKLYIKMRCTYLCIQSHIKTTTRMELYTILLKLVCAWPPVLNFTFTKILLSINKMHALPLRYLTSFFNPFTWFSRYKSLSVKKKKQNTMQFISAYKKGTPFNWRQSKYVYVMQRYRIPCPIHLFLILQIIKQIFEKRLFE